MIHIEIDINKYALAINPLNWRRWGIQRGQSFGSLYLGPLVICWPRKDSCPPA